MSAAAQAVSLLVFEAADCLMALPASEVAQLEKRSGARPLPVATEERFDLGEYFGGHESDGPWLRWARGTRCAWLRVRCVVDVVPVALSVLGIIGGVALAVATVILIKRGAFNLYG